MQNFWYSISRVVIGKDVTNKNVSPDDLLNYWNFFCTQCDVNYSSLFCKGYSQCISPARVETATSYNNHIVEMFEQRMIYYLFRKFIKILPDNVCIRFNDNK